MQVGIKDFILVSITSEGEEVWFLSKDGRVMRVKECAMRDAKRWEGIIEGYNKWLGNFPGSLMIKSRMRVYSFDSQITVYHT